MGLQHPPISIITILIAGTVSVRFVPAGAVGLVSDNKDVAPPGERFTGRLESLDLFARLRYLLSNKTADLIVFRSVSTLAL